MPIVKLTAALGDAGSRTREQEQRESLKRRNEMPDERHGFIEIRVDHLVYGQGLEPVEKGLDRVSIVSDPEAAVFEANKRFEVVQRGYRGRCTCLPLTEDDGCGVRSGVVRRANRLQEAHVLTVTIMNGRVSEFGEACGDLRPTAFPDHKREWHDRDGKGIRFESDRIVAIEGEARMHARSREGGFSGVSFGGKNDAPLLRATGAGVQNGSPVRARLCAAH